MASAPLAVGSGYAAGRARDGARRVGPAGAGRLGRRCPHAGSTGHASRGTCRAGQQITCPEDRGLQAKPPVVCILGSEGRQGRQQGHGGAFGQERRLREAPQHQAEAVYQAAHEGRADPAARPPARDPGRSRCPGQGGFGPPEHGESRRPEQAGGAEHARHAAQLRRDLLPRRQLLLRPAGPQRRGRRHAVRPDRERGHPGLRQDHGQLGARAGKHRVAVERLRRALRNVRRGRPGRGLRPAREPLGHQRARGRRSDLCSEL